MSEIQHSDIILTTKNWKRHERYVKWEYVFFNLQISCIFEKFSQCKGVTLEVKLVGRFKVFLRDSYVKEKKNDILLWKVSSHKVQKEGF